MAPIHPSGVDGPAARGRHAAHPAGAFLARLDLPWRALRAVADLEVGQPYVVIGSIAFHEGTPTLNILEVHDQVLQLVPYP